MKTISTHVRLIATILAILSIFGMFAVTASAAAPLTEASISDIPTEGFLWPAPKDKIITSPFNLESKTLQNKRGGEHAGIDIGGTFNVMASRSGKVVTVVNKGEKGGTACCVVLEHESNGKRWYTRYWHFKSGSITVKVGQTVVAGQVLGISGDTGKATGPHLHFEVSTTKDYSISTSKKMNVNPKTSQNIKYNGTYSTSACLAEINKYAKITYSFNADEVKQLSEWQKGCNRSFKPQYYYVAKDGTSRIYPAEAASKGVKFCKNDIVYVIAEGRNAYNNRWLKVRDLNSNKYYYIYEDYIGKAVTSSNLTKPAFCLLSPSAVGNKTIEIKLKNSAPKGCVYVASFTYKSGGKNVTKTTEFSGSNIRYCIGTTGYCTVEVCVRVNDSALRVKSASTGAKTVNVK